MSVILPNKFNFSLLYDIKIGFSLLFSEKLQKEIGNCILIVKICARLYHPAVILCFAASFPPLLHFSVASLYCNDRAIYMLVLIKSLKLCDATLFHSWGTVSEQSAGLTNVVAVIMENLWGECWPLVLHLDLCECPAPAYEFISFQVRGKLDLGMISISEVYSWVKFHKE